MRQYLVPYMHKKCTGARLSSTTLCCFGVRVSAQCLPRRVLLAKLSIRARYDALSARHFSCCPHTALCAMVSVPRSPHRALYGVFSARCNSRRVLRIAIFAPQAPCRAITHRPCHAPLAVQLFPRRALRAALSARRSPRGTGSAARRPSAVQDIPNTLEIFRNS